MTRNIQLLKQVRSLTTAVARTTDNPECQNLLAVTDLFLNELMLQDAPAFYLDYLERGKALLAEGQSLAAGKGGKPAAPTVWRDDLNAESRIEAIDAEAETVLACLLEVVKTLDESRSAEEKDFMVRLSRWESSHYRHHVEQVAGKPEDRAGSITREAFAAYLQKKFPQWKGLRVTQFVTLAGGLSKKTILVETEDAVNGPQSLVIRAEQPVSLLYFDGSDVALEFYMIQLMHKLGMPVPRALWLEEDASRLGTRFIVTTKSEGKPFAGSFGSLGSKEPPPPEMLDSFMRTFYQMHNLRPDLSDPLLQKSHLNEWMPHQTIRAVAHYNAAVFVPKLIRRAGIRVTPQLLRALRWLENNVPDVSDPPVIVHVDYAYNNLLFHDNRVSAVLDWETSRLGDPADDIIWTQHNLGVYSMPEFLKVYAQATGRHISEYRIAYARVQKCVLNMIASLTAFEAIEADDNAPPHMGVMAFKYMPLFGADVDELIAGAESVKGR